MKLKSLVLFACILAFVACNNKEKESTDKEHNQEVSRNDENKSVTETLANFDLNDNGIPVTLMLPEEINISKGTGVTEMNGINYKNLNLKGGAYKINVSMAEQDFEGTIVESLKSQKRLSSFDKGFNILQENENGYLYEFENSKGKNYAFVHVLIKNSREIVFTSLPSRSSNYTHEQVETMYQAVKTAK